MRVGSLVYATDQGLGILAKSFWDAGVLNTVQVVRHGKHVTHEDWYPGEGVLGNLAWPNEDVERWIESLDVFLAFETPFIWPLFDYCRAAGVKSILMPMHECLHRNVWTHVPDMFLCPSLLDLQVVQKITRPQAKSAFLPVPVDGIPWRQRTKAEVFVHNAGHGGLKGRNGTKELIDAMPLVKSPVKVIMRAQGRETMAPLEFSSGATVVTQGTVPYDQLWTEGDVFIFPEKFNGLSLPLQEARAAGMLVMCGDRFPMNTWLPRQAITGFIERPGKQFIISEPQYLNPLIPVKGYNHNQRIGPPYQEFDEAIFDPEVIAAHIDSWYGKDITQYSTMGQEWARSMSWQTLKPKYLEVMANLCGQN